MKPPKMIKPYVMSFCRSVCKGEPLFVPLRPVRDKTINDCFNIVNEHVLVEGGRSIYGWAIWEWTKVMIEAEFHCVWQTPEGNLVDIAAKPFSLDQILFLPDPKLQYKGRQINNVRKALQRNKDIERFIEIANWMYFELNKGELADYHGPVALQGDAVRLHEEMMQLQLKLARKFGMP